MSRSEGRTWRSSKPIVAISVRRATVSPDEELHPWRRLHDQTPGVRRIRQASDGPLGLELPHVMVHRGLVDAECLREGGLREVLVAVTHQKGEHVPLLRGEPLAITDPQEREGDLLVRLV